MKAFLLLLTCVLCACSKTREPETGSQTHFLSDCSSSCPAPYSCLCGVCTLECERASECADAASDAVCVAPESGTGSCDGSSKQCDVECERHADCGELGAQFSCEAGRCREGATGTSGQGGNAGASGRGGAGAGGRAGSGGAQAGAGGAQGGAGGAQGGTGGLPASCALPMQVGPCDAAFMRFYFDSVSGACTPFTWGGCEANDNNFETLAECQGACGGGSQSGSCTTSADCTLIPTGCCGECLPTLTGVEAVLAADAEAEANANCPGGPPACGPCAPQAFDPQRPVPFASCEQGRCQVVDLRADPRTQCSRDEDCEIEKTTCCEPCGDVPVGWVAKRLDVSTEFPVIGSCAGTACPDCVANEPTAFCAADGHCAVREITRVSGELSTSCYTPYQNLDDVYEPSAVGCDCGYNANGANICLPDSTATDVALTCGERWTVIQDGPCGI